MSKPKAEYKMKFCGCCLPRKEFAFTYDRDAHEVAERSDDFTRAMSAQQPSMTIFERLRDRA